jgi:hypothetical protein
MLIIKYSFAGVHTLNMMNVMNEMNVMNVMNEMNEMNVMERYSILFYNMIFF